MEREQVQGFWLDITRYWIEEEKSEGQKLLKISRKLKVLDGSRTRRDEL